MARALAMWRALKIQKVLTHCLVGNSANALPCTIPEKTSGGTPGITFKRLLSKYHIRYVITILHIVSASACIVSETCVGGKQRLWILVCVTN